MVECDLAKVEVAGSTPVSRSKEFQFQRPLAGCEGLCCQGTGRPFQPVQSGRGTQVVRERSAKPLCVGSIPTRASIYSVATLQPAVGHFSWKLPSAPDARGSARKSASPRIAQSEFCRCAPTRQRPYFQEASLCPCCSRLGAQVGLPAHCPIRVLSLRSNPPKDVSHRRILLHGFWPIPGVTIQ